jgi:hypothetical protein
MSQKQEKSMGALEAAIEGVKVGVQALAPALTLKDIIADVGTEMKGMAAHGAHELAAALFNGSAFVMYPRGTRDDNVAQEHQQENQHEQSRGREM